ncbi:hypothetical protein [Magnetococcus sp. PR-3]|uniref:hypothetical protein n=1 Tax=Magnetococcus sp. PR-3 TaxID=3120355 RepID=UPI002FCE3A19
MPEGMLLPTLTHLLLWVLFGVIHSGMSDARFKTAWCRKLGAKQGFERFIFNGVAVVTTLGLFVHAYTMLSHTPLFNPQGWLKYTLMGVQLLAIGGMMWAFKAYDMARFVGLFQVRQARAKQPVEVEPLRIGPMHRWVRHPIYTTALIYLWCQPQNYATLVLHGCATLYLIIGALLEERRLLALYGAPYHCYQQAVPMLIPLPWRYLSQDQAKVINS